MRLTLPARAQLQSPVRPGPSLLASDSDPTVGSLRRHGTISPPPSEAQIGAANTLPQWLWHADFSEEDEAGILSPLSLQVSQTILAGGAAICCAAVARLA